MSYYLVCPIEKNYHSRATWINAMFGLPMHCERLCFLDYALTKFIGISHKRMMMVVHIVPPKKGVFSAEIEGLLFQQDKTGAMHSCAPQTKQGCQSNEEKVSSAWQISSYHTWSVACSCAGCHKVNEGKLLGD